MSDQPVVNIAVPDDVEFSALQHATGKEGGMTPLEMIAEWRRGCSCSIKDRPEECLECTRALIDAIERALRAAPWAPIDASCHQGADRDGVSKDTQVEGREVNVH